jgi:hypothetical protein
MSQDGAIADFRSNVHAHSTPFATRAAHGGLTIHRPIPPIGAVASALAMMPPAPRSLAEMRTAPDEIEPLGDFLARTRITADRVTDPHGRARNRFDNSAARTICEIIALIMLPALLAIGSVLVGSMIGGIVMAMNTQPGAGRSLAALGALAMTIVGWLGGSMISEMWRNRK